jgi:hypothetical protein
MKPKPRKDRDGAKADPDYQMFASMTQDEAAQWVEDNCTADANTKKALKVVMRTFTAIAGGL